MPKVVFQPSGHRSEVEPNTKLLVAAIRAKAPIRYGCASCRCGTCGVRIDQGRDALKPMTSNERDLLERMGLATDGHIRLACQARLIGDQEVVVDLQFQESYSPDDGEFD